MTDDIEPNDEHPHETNDDAEIPEGAAVFPTIPPELGVDPLLLTVLHAAVFLSGSQEDVVNPDAAEEALQYMAEYLQRLEGARLKRVQEDITCLLKYARSQQWSKQAIRSLREFLTELGVLERGKQ